MLCKVKKEGGTEDLDKTLCTLLSDSMDIVELIEEFHDVMKSASTNPLEHDGLQRKLCQISQTPGGQRN